MLRLFRRARPRLRDEVAALARTSAELARQVGEISHRLAALEDKVMGSLTDWREPPPRDVGALSVQVKQMTDAVARHDAAVQTVPMQPQAAPPETSAGVLAQAIADDRIELYLQPIVTLPQRQVRCYEASVRVRGGDGAVLALADTVDGPARAELDRLMLFRCVQVVRRLQVKNREVGVICHIDAATLSDEDAFKEMLDFTTANQALAGVLILAFGHAAYRDFKPAARENLAALAARGFHFALDSVTDLRIEPRELAVQGFRVVKAPAALVLASSAHVAELLARAGIDLIADGIEDEGSALDLLDRDVRCGQGALFCGARPARPDALQANGAVLTAAAR